MPGRYESPLLPTVAGQTVYTVNHGRGTPPRWVRWVLVNMTTDLAYIPGDELEVAFYPSSVPGCGGIWSNAAQIGLSLDNDLTQPDYAKKDGTGGGVITLKNWKLKAYADF